MTFEKQSGHVLVAGLGIGGFRSMPDLRILSPLGKVNLLAGQNNVGKSNVIRFLERYMRTQAVLREWDDEPRPRGEPLTLATAHRLDKDKYEAWVNQAKARTDKFLALPSFHLTEDDLTWVVRSQNVTRQLSAERTRTVGWQIDPGWMEALQEEAEGNVSLTNLRQGLFNEYGGTPENNIKALVDHLFPFAPPKIEIIRALLIHLWVSSGRVGLGGNRRG